MKLFLKQHIFCDATCHPILRPQNNSQEKDSNFLCYPRGFFLLHLNSEGFLLNDNELVNRREVNVLADDLW